MKTLRMIGMALFAVLLCVNFTSCSTDENAVLQEPKKITVSLGFEGEFQVTESPLSRTTNNDLYYVKASAKNGSQTSPRYIYGLFDDVSDMNIELIENNTYYMSALIVKDGKTKLLNTDGIYNSPFNNISLNKTFTYSDSSTDTGSLTNVLLADGNAYGIPNIDAYLNSSSNEYTAQEGEDITINMARNSFGAKFIAEKLTDGTLKVSLKAEGVSGDAGKTFYSPTFELTQSNLFTDQIFLMPQITTSTTQNPQVYANLSVICTWVKSNGDEVNLGSPVITFERNKKTTIKIKVAQDVENGINFTYMDNEEMGDGGTYNVDGNTATQE